MEVTVYWDILLLRIWLFDSLFLLLGGVFLGKKAKIRRILLTGSLQAFAWLVLFAIAVPSFVKTAVEFFLCLGGFLYCYGLRRNGYLLGLIACLQTALCFYGGKKSFLVYLLMVAGLALLQKTGKKKRICKVTFSYRQKEVSCLAFVDSGNFLREPFRGRPVSIINRHLLPEGAKAEEVLMVPFHTLGRKAGLLPVIRVGPVRLETDLQQFVLPEMLLGLSDENFGKEYQMLLHRSFDEIV